MMNVALSTRVGGFLKYQFRIGQRKFYMAMDQHARPDRTTPLHSTWSMALSPMTVECEQFICLMDWLWNGCVYTGE